MSYYVIKNWDINRIRKLAPRMDAPVRMLNYNDIPCSVYGEPLVFESGKYRGMFGTSKLKRINEDISSKIMYNISHPDNIKKPGYQRNRFIVAVRDEHSNIDPIVEVTNNGRCFLRCSQWARVLNAKHIEGKYVLTPSKEEYDKLLEKLSDRLVV